MMSDRPHLTIVLPAYNEEARLPASLERVIAFLGAQPYASELIVSDDGSTDSTPDIVRRIAETGPSPENVGARLVRAPQNAGKGAAIRRGVLEARGEYVFFMDADLATPPEDLAQLLARLESDADVAIGSRIQPDGSDMRASQPLQRRLAGKLFTFMRKAMRVLPEIDDTQCPLKGFRADAARAIFNETRLTGWIFDAEVLYVARSLGYRIASLPVRWQHVEGSRLRVRPQMAYEVARDLIRLRRLHPAKRR
jgi:dolichyl-phosphate beta-glucosyltransferase